MSRFSQLPLRSLLCLPTVLALGACAQLQGLTGGHDDGVYDRQAEAVQAYEEGADAHAEALLQGVLRVSPNDAEDWFRLGNLYARTDRPDLAVDAFQKSLMLRNGDARVWHNLAVVRVRQAQAAIAQANALSVNDAALYDKTSRMAEQLQRVLTSPGKQATVPQPVAKAAPAPAVAAVPAAAAPATSKSATVVEPGSSHDASKPAQ